MAAKLKKIRAVQVGAETTFGTLASTLVSLRVLADSDAKLEQSSMVNDIAKAGDYGLARIPGGKRGTITLRFNLHGYSGSVPSAAPAVVAADNGSASAFDIEMGLIGSALGNLYAGGFINSTTVAATGSPTDTLTVSGGDELTSFESGQAVAWATGTTRRAYEMGWITNNTADTPDTAALLQTPRRDPQGTVLWGSYNAFVRTLSPYHDGNVKSWTVKFIGHGADDVTICYGCWVQSGKIMVGVNQIPVVELTLGIGHWTQPGSGGGPAVPSWTFPEPQPALDWQFAIGNGSGVVYPTVKSLELDFGLQVVALDGGHSDSGVEGWAVTQRLPKLTAALQYSADWFSTFTAQTETVVTFQHGTQPGKMFGFALPAARLVELPQRGDQDGITIVDTEWEAHLYTGDAGADLTKPVDSPLKLAWA